MHEHFTFETPEDLDRAKQRLDEIKACFECQARFLETHRRQVRALLAAQRAILETQLAEAEAAGQGLVAEMVRTAILQTDRALKIYEDACAEDDQANPKMKLAADWEKAGTEDPS